MSFPKQILCLLSVLLLSIQIDGNRPKRMFALCPPHFIRIGNECYFISQDRVNWLDAHFERKDRNSRLAEPYKQEDRFLRKYLNHLAGTRPDDIWIGARYNWERNKWQWGHSGQDLTYQSFSQMSVKKDLKFHCAILNPHLKYRWSASSCEQQHQYICQHRMPYVSEKNRQRIYTKWNETYPNEMANEVEVVLSEDDLLRKRKMHRSHMRTSNRQVKNDANYRQPNDIHYNHFLQPNQTPNPNRKNRMGGNRSRAPFHRRKFELNRDHGNGIRQRIQFNSTNNASNRQMNRNRAWRQQHQRFNIPMNPANTANPTHWTITNAPEKSSFITSTTARPRPSTTMTTTTTTESSPAPPILTSNDVTHYEDRQYQQQLDEEEQRRYDEKLRRMQENLDEARRLEQERIQNEERMRAQHQLELERRRQQIANERQQALENERIQSEKRKQDLERQQQNEINRQRYEDEQNRQAELMKQQNEQKTYQQAIQTNEILEENSSTTLSPVEKKKAKLKEIHHRLRKLSPEQQALFFQRRAELKNKKRGVEHQLQ